MFPVGPLATDVWPAGDLKRKLALGKQKGICLKVRKSSGSLWIKERVSETNRGWVWGGAEHLYDAGWRPGRFRSCCGRTGMTYKGLIDHRISEGP